MQIILLSGGSGKRLWPISNDARSKQFIKLFQNEKGEYESMIQRIYRQIRRVYPEANIVIATCEAQVDSIKSQLEDKVEIVVEPARSGTFPAIILAGAYLLREKQVDEEEPVLVVPVDSYVGNAYYNLFLLMEEMVSSREYDIALMGVRPTYPSAKYGYILTSKKEVQDGNPVYQVESFTEKPDEATARKLIAQGALWDSGVFGFRLSYLASILMEYGMDKDYESIRADYSFFKKNSFDKEVIEKSDSVCVLQYHGRWKDLGTWNTLTEEMSDDYLGTVVTGEEICNTTIINELAIPIVALGTQNLVIAASADGILVSDKQKSSYIKPYVESMDNRPMYEERRWGEYQVLDYVKYEDGVKSLTKHLTVKAGKHLSYQSHDQRDEVWTIVDGEGELVIEDAKRHVSRGEVINIPRKQRHAIRAITDLQFVEVQIGSSLEEADIHRYEWDWNC